MRTLSEIHGAIVLSDDEIVKRLTSIGWPKIIDAIAETFVEEANGKVVSPAKTIIGFPETNSDFRVMPGYMEKYPNLCGVKIIGACTDNPKKYGLPLAIGTYILNDTATQRPLMMFDAAIPTAWRTAAATAVSVWQLSSLNATTLGIIGCGVQAHYHVPAIQSVRNITKILVCDLDETKMNRMIETFGEIVVKATQQEVLDQADIVVTLTPTTEPHIFIKDIPQREMLLCAIGGDSEKKIEFEPSVVTVVDHFCDSLDQVKHTGTISRALEEQYVVPKELKSLGKLMVGQESLDVSKPVKMFLSTGVALEDLAIARLLYTEILLP